MTSIETNPSVPGFSYLVVPATPQYMRNTEASILPLHDGRLLLAWSRFYGGIEDAASAEIAAMTSEDNGRTWSEPYVLQSNEGGQNVMSVSLLRISPEEIAFFYLVKNSDTDLHLWVRFSQDEGASWSDASRVTTDPGYNIVNNDRVVRLSTGRLLAPVSACPDIGPRAVPLVSFVVYSDDSGRSWKRSGGDITAPLFGAMEPGVVELTDGSLLMIIRTQAGCIYNSHSYDGGETWTEGVPSEIVAPVAPSTIVRIPSMDKLLLFWNNNPEATTNFACARTPLTCAISSDDGKTWEHVRDIETNPNLTYAYLSAAFAGGSVLLTYYETEDWSKGLSLRLRSIPLSWFLEAN